MIRVRALYLAVFAEVTQRREEVIALEQATMGHLIEALGNRYGEKFKETLFDPGTGDIVPGVAVLVNGCPLPWAAELQEGDEVAFLVSYAGG